MSFHCFRCQAKQDVSDPTHVGRRDTCASCGSDLHACLNCRHYDKTAYNMCKEPQAERVLDKDRSNFCDYFSYRDGKGSGLSGPTKEDRAKKLDDLFKK